VTRRMVRPAIEIVMLSFGLLVAAALFAALLPDLDQSILPSNRWTIWILAFAFGATLLTVFRIEFRNNAILFSLSEIPLTFALVFLPPAEGLAGRICASALVYTIIKRPPLQKQFFNLAMFAFETMAAYYFVRQMLSPDEMSDVSLVLASTASVALAGILGSVAVALAVSRFVGDTLRHIVDELKAAWVLVVNAAMAGALLSLYLISATLAALAIVPVIALWFMMRRHGILAQRLRDLHAVYGFAGRVGRSLDLDEIGRSAISEASELLRADVTVLAVLGSDGPDHIYADPEVSQLPRKGLFGNWVALSQISAAELTTGKALAEAGLGGFEHCGDVIIAPVDDEIGAIGVLVLARRAHSDSNYSHDDVDRAVNLADQLGSSLRKGMLHRQIQYEARHDSLTGLPNRLAFQRHFEEVAPHPPAGQRGYVMMMDLDRFKEVNDTLGHHAGDEMLIEFARRVSDELGSGAFLARLAGDEFAVITFAPSDEHMMSIAQQCIAAGARPLTLHGLSLVVTASVGVAPIAPGNTDHELSLRHADIAMYNAKSRHVGIEFFQPEFDRRTPARLSMLGDLRRAIEEEHLDLEYQPKLDLASGMITGAEALVRWTDDVRGVVSPNDFVRVAEETGLIQQLTDMMLARGIAELRHLHERGHPLSLSVNLSTHDLMDAKLATRVAQYLSRNDVEPGSLTLEITESSLLVDAPRSKATIQELHELGVRLSIDDFGTGYSSLSYLRQLPVSELKVDQSFIANMLVEQPDEVIVRSTIDLGHNLGLEVVAEGVESEQTLQQLREIGCDVAQGFSISRPLNAERFQAWLHATNYPSRRVDPLHPEAWGLGIDDPVRDDNR
jgi:diguanylate cyclase (GGDEF)-like protein